MHALRQHAFIGLCRPLQRKGFDHRLNLGELTETDGLFNVVAADRAGMCKTSGVNATMIIRPRRVRPPTKLEMALASGAVQRITRAPPSLRKSAAGSRA